MPRLFTKIIKINSQMPINKALLNLRGISTAQSLKQICEDGKCDKRNADMRFFLSMPFADWLQPSKLMGKAGAAKKKSFKISEPFVKPIIEYEHELYCREKAECRKLRRVTTKLQQLRK